MTRWQPRCVRSPRAIVLIGGRRDRGRRARRRRRRRGDGTTERPRSPARSPTPSRRAPVRRLHRRRRSASAASRSTSSSPTTSDERVPGPARAGRTRARTTGCSSCSPSTTRSSFTMPTVPVPLDIGFYDAHGRGRRPPADEAVPRHRRAAARSTPPRPRSGTRSRPLTGDLPEGPLAVQSTRAVSRRHGCVSHPGRSVVDQIRRGRASSARAGSLPAHN